MLTPGYPHEIEYRFERAKGVREHEYTELVDDMGFVLEHRADRREAWLVRYATTCARDYFGRVLPRPGMWVISVYRLLPDQRRHVVTIRMRWKKADNEP